MLIIIIIQKGFPTGDDEILRLQIRDGNFWVGSTRDFTSKKALKEKGEEDWEDNNHSVWLVVKSFKSNTTNKVYWMFETCLKFYSLDLNLVKAT